MLLTGMAVAAMMVIGASGCGKDSETERVEENPDARNIVMILVDDQRYDAAGFMGHPYLDTPSLDRLASHGVHFKNAFVTTSLCSPSRASILTGLYTHNHGVVSNNDGMPDDLKTFPMYLQEAGYQTAFIGKWHMGGSSDRPRPGFDHWVSFRGQGRYLPPESGDRNLNVNGEAVAQKGYITDELTDYAIDWLGTRDPDKPFLLYLSHKAVHDNFTPAKRHAGRYEDEPFPTPETQANTTESYDGKPMWVYNQRNSWHGVDFPYHGSREAEGGIEQLYRNYTEALLAVDESVGRIIDYLDTNNLAENTLLLYMGDNGFLWGEHGLIDKRNAYEESMRVPMLAYAPSLIDPGKVLDAVVANIDVAPTFLDLAGLAVPEDMDGSSFLDLMTGEMPAAKWRKSLLYEYYWEWNFPHTPSVFALREDRFKLIQYHGVWDTDELYDLVADPKEKVNLIRNPAYENEVKRMRQWLHAQLEGEGANRVPFSFKRGDGANLRSATGPRAAPFPERLKR